MCRPNTSHPYTHTHTDIEHTHVIWPNHLKYYNSTPVDMASLLVEFPRTVLFSLSSIFGPCCCSQHFVYTLLFLFRHGIYFILGYMLHYPTDVPNNKVSIGHTNVGGSSWNGLVHAIVRHTDGHNDRNNSCLLVPWHTN